MSKHVITMVKPNLQRAVQDINCRNVHIVPISLQNILYSGKSTCKRQK